MIKRILSQINSFARYIANVLNLPSIHQPTQEDLSATLIETPETSIEDLASCQFCLENENESHQEIYQDDCISENKHNYHIACLSTYWSSNEAPGQFKCIFSQKIQAQTIWLNGQKSLIIHDRSIASAFNLPLDDHNLNQIAQQLQKLLKTKQFLIKAQHYNQSFSSDITNTTLGVITGILIDLFIICSYRSRALKINSFNNMQDDIISNDCHSYHPCTIKEIDPFADFYDLCQPTPLLDLFIYGLPIAIFSAFPTLIQSYKELAIRKLNLSLPDEHPMRLSQLTKKIKVKAIACNIAALFVANAVCEFLYRINAVECSYADYDEFWDEVKKNQSGPDTTYIKFNQDPSLFVRSSCFTPVIFAALIVLVNLAIKQGSAVGLKHLDNKINDHMAQYESQLVTHLNATTSSPPSALDSYTSVVYNPNIKLFKDIQKMSEQEHQPNQQSFQRDH